MPVYATHQISRTSGDLVVSERSGSSLLAREQLRAVVVLAFPPVVATAVLAARKRRSAVLARSLAAMLICVFAVIGSASVGGLFVPSGILMALAAFKATTA